MNQAKPNNMLSYYRACEAGRFPCDGCWLLVRDAWQRFFNAAHLPVFQNFTQTYPDANQLMQVECGIRLAKTLRPVHGAMVTGEEGGNWHCGIIYAPSAPAFVIHVQAGAIKVEPLVRFKARFSTVELFNYVGDVAN